MHERFGEVHAVTARPVAQQTSRLPGGRRSPGQGMPPRLPCPRILSTHVPSFYCYIYRGLASAGLRGFQLGRVTGGVGRHCLKCSCVAAVRGQGRRAWHPACLRYYRSCRQWFLVSSRTHCAIWSRNVWAVSLGQAGSLCAGAIPGSGRVTYDCLRAVNNANMSAVP